MPSSKHIRAERKRQFEKTSEGCRKDFFIKHTPNDNNNNKNNPHKYNNSDNKNCIDDCPSNNNADDIHTGPNPYRINVTDHNHRLMLVSQYMSKAQNNYLGTI